MIPMNNANWRSVRDALESALPLLGRLTPPVIETFHVGPDNGNEGYRVTLKVFTDRDLTLDERQRAIDQARPIIERCLRNHGYPPSAISTFTYGVMYANSERNMRVVEKALETALPNLRKLTPAVLSTFHWGPFSGYPDGFQIYFSVQSNKELQPSEKCQLIEHAKPLVERELLSSGYSSAAIRTFSYVIVRQEDIDKVGGWYNFLR